MKTLHELSTGMLHTVTHICIIGHFSRHMAETAP